MTPQVLQTDAKSLRMCMLYEFFRKKPILETFQNFCEVMGPDAVEFEEFKFWFDRFAKGDFDLNGEMSKEARTLELVESAELTKQILKNMPPRLISTDCLVIRLFIMHDALVKKPVFEGFNDMCQILPQCDYSDYDYWYYRFLAGDLDVTYDRSCDPKPPKLEELPVDVVMEILDKVDIETRFEIRKLSQTMQFAVDQLRTDIDEIVIVCHENSICATIKADNSSWKHDWSEEIYGGNFMKAAFDDLEFYLNPTKVQVDKFMIDAFCPGTVKPLVDWIVATSNRKSARFDMKAAYINTLDYNLTLKTLSVIKPGSLKILDTGYYNERKKKDERIDMNRIKEMEQFKKVKNAYLDRLGVIQSTDLSIFLNFQEFWITVQSMEPEDVVLLRNDLLSKPNFEKCVIRLITPFESLTGIARLFGSDGTDELSDFNVECNIPNSAEVLYFHIEEGKIKVKKRDSTLSDDDEEEDSDTEEDSDDEQDSDEEQDLDDGSEMDE